MKHYYRVLYIILIISLSAVGCSKKASHRSALKGSVSSGDNAEPPFELMVQAPSSGKLGSNIAATVQVVPKGEYKINVEYPHRLIVDGPHGATPQKASLDSKKATKLTKSELVFKTVFQLTSAGKHSFNGVLKFSVCTERQCEIKNEKVQWVTTINE